MRRSRSHLGPEFSLSNHIFCTKDSACRECEVKSLKLRLTNKKKYGNKVCVVLSDWAQCISSHLEARHDGFL